MFLAKYEAKYEAACECLNKDRDVLLDLLRLPGRALDPFADDEPDRIDVRDDPATAPPNQGKRHQRKRAWP